MKWFKEHKKAASIGLFLLVPFLIGCGVAFSGSGNGSDQKEQEASVTDEKKDTVTDEKSSDAEVKKRMLRKKRSLKKKRRPKKRQKRRKDRKKDDTKKTSTASATATTKKMKRKLLPISHPAIPVQRRQRQNPTDPVLPVAFRVSRSIHIPG